MRISRQARYNSLQEKLHNAVVIKERLTAYKAKHNIVAISELLKSDDSIPADHGMAFGEAFSGLKELKAFFDQHRSLEKQDYDTLKSELDLCRTTVITLSKRLKKQNEEAGQRGTERITGLIDALQEKHMGNGRINKPVFLQDCQKITDAFRQETIMPVEIREELWQRFRSCRSEISKAVKEQQRQRRIRLQEISDRLKKRTEVQEAYLARISEELEQWFTGQGKGHVITLDTPVWVIKKARKQKEITDELQQLKIRLADIEKKL